MSPGEENCHCCWRGHLPWRLSLWPECGFSYVCSVRSLAKARLGSEDHQVRWLSPGTCPPLSAKRRSPLGASPWLSGLLAPLFPSHLTAHSHAFAGLWSHPDPFQTARRTRRLIPGCPGPSWMLYTLLLIFTLSRDPERKML